MYLVCLVWVIHNTDGGQKTTPGSPFSLSTVGCQARQQAPLPLSYLISLQIFFVLSHLLVILSL